MHISGNTISSTARASARSTNAQILFRLADLSPGPCWNCTDAARILFMANPNQLRDLAERVKASERWEPARILAPRRQYYVGLEDKVQYGGPMLPEERFERIERKVEFLVEEGARNASRAYRYTLE